VLRKRPVRRHRYIFGRNGAHTGLVNFMINQHRVDEKSDVEAYISRVGAIGGALDQLIERAKLAAGDGIRMPGFAYDQTADEIKRVTTGAPFCPGTESALFADGKAKIKALAEASKLKPEEAVALTEQLRLAMVDKMKPAYEQAVGVDCRGQEECLGDAAGSGFAAEWRGVRTTRC